jgi:hypothetical protein
MYRERERDPNKKIKKSVSKCAAKIRKETNIYSNKF